MGDLLKVIADKFLIGDGCWEWVAYRDKDGYGTVRVGDRKPRAHRVLYELMVGPIGEGLVLDHICHNADPNCCGGPGCVHRGCVRPDHLEPKTRRENTLSSPLTHANKDRCSNGHEFTEENTYRLVADDGGSVRRHCRTCNRLATARRRGRLA